MPAVRGERPPVLSTDVPHDFGEAFRSLRTALVFTSGSASSRIIGVTSTQPLEGNTTTAANMALVLALGSACQDLAGIEAGLVSARDLPTVELK